MGFIRSLLGGAGNLARPARQGDGLVAFLSPVVVATDAARTLSIADIATGFIQFTGFTAGRALTVPTAAQIAAAYPDMDIGDSYSIIVSVVPAFAATWTANTGVTLAGRTTTPASSWSIVVITRTAAAAYEWRVS